MLIAYHNTPILTIVFPYMVFPYLFVFNTTVSHLSQFDTSDMLAYISGTPESKHRGRLKHSSLKVLQFSLVYSHLPFTTLYGPATMKLNGFCTQFPDLQALTQYCDSAIICLQEVTSVSLIY